MRKVSVIFGSTTGNTEKVAEIIKEQIEGDVTLCDVTKATDEMIRKADLVLFGSSTWGYGELQDDFQDYYDNMSSDLLDGKLVAVFGCGDMESFEDVFCNATELIKTKAEGCGAKIVAENLKVNGEPDENLEMISEFAKSL